MFVFKAAVVGAGVMGGEIAQVIAAADIPVLLKDVDQKFVDAGLAKAREVTESQVAKLVTKGSSRRSRATRRSSASLGQITGTTAYDGFGDVDFAIEAVPEKMEIKHGVFAELDAATPGHAILASNTSGLSITEIGDATQRPDKVVGFHFFWPASFMRLIEVDRGRGDLPGDAPGGRQLRAADPQDADPLRRVPRLRRQPHPDLDASEIWRYQDETGVPVEELDEFIKEQAQMPMGPFRSPTCRASTRS